MKRLTTGLGLSLLAAVAIGGAAAGCSHQTEGQETREQATGMSDAADMILTGERHVADGDAQIARGQAIKDQGDATEGDRQIAEGKTTKALGEEQIAQGKKLKEKNQ